MGVRSEVSTVSRKDYYAILGIPTRENQTGIKGAFRELAQRYHPDRAGVHSTKRFQDIAEAYQTLGDRERRAAYDQSRRRAAEETPVHPAEPAWGVPVEPFEAQPEAFQDDQPRRPSARFSVMDDFIGTSPLHEAVFHAFRKSFDDRRPRKFARLDPLNLVIGLSREEARSGVDMTLGVPVVSPCAHCHGSGRLWLYACSRCRGGGWVTSQDAVQVRIPAMVDDGTLIEVPLRGLGIESVYLRLLVRVAEYGI